MARNTYKEDYQEIARFKARRQAVADISGNDVQKVAQHEANVAIRREIYDKVNLIHQQTIEFQQKREEEQEVTKEVQDNIAKIVEGGCVHPMEKLEYHSNHVSGSYLDREYTDSWVECRCCGMLFDERHVTGSSYG